MTRRPLLLDLFCGAGGAAVGYHRAGFDVIGVDNQPHPDYPFHFHQADALTFPLDGFDAIHASPPCPRYSIATHASNRDTHPDYVPPMQTRLRASGLPYIIENVPGAPLDHPLLICGWAMGLRHIRRHRLFESNVPLMSPGCLCPNGDTVSVFGHSGEDRRKTTNGVRTHAPIAEVRQLMGVEWMSRRGDVSDAIPPAYTQHIGEQLIDHLRREATP